MKDSVQAGLLANIANFIKSLSQSLDRILNKLIDYGMEVKDSKKTDNGGVLFKLDVEGEDAEMETTPVADNPGYFDVRFKLLGQEIKLDNIKEADIEREIKDMLSEKFNIDITKVKSSSDVVITLKKVQANKQTEIQLTSIQASCTATKAVKALKAIVANDELMEMIEEEPTALEVFDDGDELDVEVITIEDTSSTIVDETYYHMMHSAMKLWSNLKTLHWNSIGENFFQLHEKLDTYIDAIQCDLDFLGELCIEKCGSVQNPTWGFVSEELIGPDSGFNINEGFRIAKEQILEYIDVLETFYVNLDHDIQSELDTVIRYWKKESEYKLRQQQS